MRIHLFLHLIFNYPSIQIIKTLSYIKTRIWYLLLLALVTTSCTPTFKTVPDKEHLIEGTLTHIPDSIWVHLFRSEQDILFYTATETLRSGKFSFTDTISTPLKLHILINRNKGFLNSALEVRVASGK